MPRNHSKTKSLSSNLTFFGFYTATVYEASLNKVKVLLL